MKKKAIVFGVVIALLIVGLASVAVYAVQTQTGGHPMMAMHGMMLRRLAAELKLTDAQKQQIEGIYKEFRTENQADLQSIKTLKLQMLDIVTSQAPDKVKAEELVGEMSQIQTKLMTSGIDKIIEAKQVLTAEQNKTLAEKIQHFRPMIEHCPLGK